MKKGVLLSFIVAIIVFISTGTLVIHYTCSILAEDREIVSLAEAFTALDKFRLSFRSAITSHNFYLLTQNEKYLREYQQFKKEVTRNIDSVELSTFNTFLSQGNMDSIQLLVTKQFSLLDSVLFLSQIRKYKWDNRLFDNQVYPVYTKIGELAEDQSSDLESMQRKIKNNSEIKEKLILSILVLGFTVGLLFILYAFFNLVRENRMKRKSMQEIKQYADELKSANWTKDMFFSIIAHDLRSPFNSLLNLFELLNEAIERNDLSMISQNINSIEFSARRTFNLLQNLLEWSKLQTGRLNIIPEFFNIREVVEENMALYKEAAYLKSIRLINFIGDIMVYADKNVTGTILRNLLGNAIKFTARGSIFLEGKKEAYHLVICISDTGIGLTKEDMKKLFRIEVNTAEIGDSPEKGSGLGLILSKNFVELNKGKIWVESQPGKGSTFYFTIPLQRNCS